MADYAALNCLFLGVSLIAVIALSRRAIFTRAKLFGLGGLLLLTAVFDNLIIAAGIVAYDPATLSGFYVGIAPIEDFAYAVTAALFIPFIFEKTRSR